MKGNLASVKLYGALLAVFLLFQWLGSTVGSDRGQAGLLIGFVILAAILAAESFLFGRQFLEAAALVGLGRPARPGMLVAISVGLLLLLVFPLFAWLTGAAPGLTAGWFWMLPGLFAQAGIAEETLFRGYLFGHLRRGRSFWRAASISAIPFAIVHLILFFTLPWPIATASFSLAVITSFPFAWLFELGGRTIWPPAIVHFVIQGAIKVITVTGETSGVFPLIWIAASALIPLTAFFARPSMHKMGAVSA